MEALVLERRQTEGEDGAGLQLAPNATRLLRELGLEEELRACSLAPEVIEIRSWRDEAGWRVPLGSGLARRHGAPYLICHRGDVLALLRRRVQHEMMTGREVQGFAQGEGGVAAQCADGSAVEGDFLIGADGVHSCIRRQLFSQAGESVGSAHIAWRLQLEQGEAARAMRGRVCVWCGRGRHLVAYPLPETRRGRGRINIVAVMENPTCESGAATPGEEVIAAFGDWEAMRRLGEAGEVGGMASFSRLPWKKYHLSPGVFLPRWSHGRIGLLGDAAHPLLPFLAQGAGMALEDAFALADGLKRGDGLNGLDCAFRRKRIERLRRAIAFQGRLFHRRGVWGRLAWRPEARLLGRYFPEFLRNARLDWLYGGRRAKASG